MQKKQFRVSLNISDKERDLLEEKAWRARKRINNYVCDLIREDILLGLAMTAKRKR